MMAADVTGFRATGLLTPQGNRAYEVTLVLAEMDAMMLMMDQKVIILPTMEAEEENDDAGRSE